MWWHKTILKGRDLTQKLNSSGQPSTSIIKWNVNTMTTINREDKHLSVGDLKAQITISKIIVHHTLTKSLKMWCHCSIWVPHFLTSKQLSSERQFARNDWKWSRYLQKGRHVWRKLSAPFQTNTQVTKRHMEDHNLTEKEKSPASAIGWKSYADRIFWVSWNGLPALSPRKTKVNSENYCSVLRKLWEHIAKNRLDIKNT